MGLGLLAAGIAACVSLPAVSSGQIGCAEDEIKISHDESGWGSRTWVAECKGKRFFCTAVVTGKDSGQVNCRDALANTLEGGAESFGRPPTVAPAPPRHAAPKGAAGFSFGSMLAAASAACTDAGYEWQASADGQAVCSGTPASVGVDASTTLRFCDGAVCAIALSIAAPNAWMGAYGRFDRILQNKYGRPVASTGELREGCQNEIDFEACVTNRGLKIAREWQWDSGERVLLKLGPGDGAPTLQVLYIRRRPSVAGDAL